MIGRTIETKESQERANADTNLQNCPHNDILLVVNQTRNNAAFNMFTMDNNAGDPMVVNTGSRIGDLQRRLRLEFVIINLLANQDSD
jgi:hypothetical protein